LAASRQAADDQQRALVNEVANARRKARERGEAERQELSDRVLQLTRDFDSLQLEVKFASYN
jgi:hypothetical protein